MVELNNAGTLACCLLKKASMRHGQSKGEREIVREGKRLETEKTMQQEHTQSDGIECCRAKEKTKEA